MENQELKLTIITTFGANIQMICLMPAKRIDCELIGMAYEDFPFDPDWIRLVGINDVRDAVQLVLQRKLFAAYVCTPVTQVVGGVRRSA